jgi:outer membrane receptor for ferrienterochelin and colicins
MIPLLPTVRPRGRTLFLLGLLAVGRALAGDPAAPPSTNLTELSFDDLMQVKASTVYAASKRDQMITEAPATVTVVTSDDVKKFGYRTLSDVLNSVPGFYVTSDRNYSYIGVRGINRPEDFGGRILIMVDGQRINEPIYDQAFNGHEFPVDVDLIDHVEVIQGPGSSLYGNNAAFSVINVVTREGKALNGLEVSGSAGSYEAFSGRMSYGKRFESGLDLLLSGTLFDSAGEQTLYFPEWSEVNNGVAENLDGERSGQGFLSVRYKDFTLESAYGHRKKDVPTAPFEGAVFNLEPNYTIDDRAFVNLKYEHEFDHGWQVLARVYYDYYHYKLEAPFGEDASTAVYNVDYNRADSWGGEVQVSKTLFDRHALTGGVELRDDIQVVQKNYDVDPYFPYTDIESDSLGLGVYLQDEYSVLTNLLLNVGVRYDHYSSFGGTANPRLGVIYSPWTTTTFKAIYGRAYRAPNAFESNYYFPDEFVANPDLGPEYVRSTELAWEQAFGRHLRLSTSLFYNRMEDLITQVNIGTEADPVLTFDNADTIDVYGVEVALSGYWPSGLRGRVSYTYAHAEDSGTDQWLSNSPEHLAKLNLVAPLYRDKLFGGIEVQGMTARRTLGGNEIDGFAVVNLTLFSQHVIKNLEFSGSVYNLFNADYAAPGGMDNRQDTIPQLGRTFRVKLTYRF